MTRRRFELTDDEWLVIEPLLPNKPRGVPRVDDRRVVSGIVYVIRNGLQWKDAPKGYGPHKTLYNRFCWFPRGTEPVFPPRSEPPLSMVF